MIRFLGAALGSLGFGFIFHIRGNKLWFAALTGGIGGLVYELVLGSHSNVVALFFASVVISIFSEIFARVFKCPVTTFLISSLIPLVPGGGMYYTMLEIVQNDINGAILKGIDTISQACSIAVGCILISSIMKMVNQYKIKGKKQ